MICKLGKIECPNAKERKTETQAEEDWYYGDKTIVSFDKKISKNKAIDIQIGRWNKSARQIISLNLGYKKKDDHAGLTFEIELFGCYFYFNLYDIRHWDWDKDDWEVYKEK